MENHHTLNRIRTESAKVAKAVREAEKNEDDYQRKALRDLWLEFLSEVPATVALVAVEAYFDQYTR